MRSRSACFDSLTFIAQFGFGGNQYFLGRAIADSAPATLVDSSLQTFQLLAFVLVAAYEVTHILAGVVVLPAFGLGLDPRLHGVRQREIQGCHGQSSSFWSSWQ